MKKLIGIITALMFSICLIGCESEDAVTAVTESSQEMIETSEEIPEEDLFRVCVILGERQKDSKESELFLTGARQAATEFSVELQVLEGAERSVQKANIQSACESGYDWMIGASPELAEDFFEYGKKYPDIRFTILEADVELPNVKQYYFAYEECFFLAGAVAAMTAEQMTLDETVEETVIGWIGGMNIPVIQEYYAAYEQGARYVNPDLRIVEGYVGSWSDPEKGKEAALAQFEQGAAVITYVASEAGAGILEAAKEQERYLIGMGPCDEEEYSGTVLTSVVECMDRVAYRMIRDAAEGVAAEDVHDLSLRDDAIGLSDFSCARESFGDQFSVELVEVYELLRGKLISGEIVIGTELLLGDRI